MKRSATTEEEKENPLFEQRLNNAFHLFYPQSLLCFVHTLLIAYLRNISSQDYIVDNFL
ncbi:MAG: hypothetical protein M3297_09570 [Thermoproteota archaeon]|nr:hypothetical protein [Thermoproteota archaeon]